MIELSEVLSHVFAYLREPDERDGAERDLAAIEQYVNRWLGCIANGAIVVFREALFMEVLFVAD